MNVYVCILIMSSVTYALRFFPLLVLRKKISNRFVVSFLYYAPYVTLSVLVFPSVLYCTPDMKASVAGLICALAASLCRAGLVLTVVLSCAVVYLVQLIF